MTKRAFIEDSGISVVAETTKTLVQLVAATNHGITIVAWGVGFNSVAAADEPIACRLQIQTTAGTSGASTQINHRNHSLDGHETIDTTGRDAFTVEPSKDTNFPTRLVHPTSGYEIWFPEGDEIVIGSAERIGLEVVPGALASTLDQVSGFIDFIE